jgi:hypothetical protein
MAGRAPRGHRNEYVKRRARAILRLAGRLTAASMALLVTALICVQFARIIGENLGMVHQLNAINSDVVALEKRRAQQLRELQRLQDPQGAVPEIHDRLRLVRSNEELIFVSPMPSSTP